MGITSQTNYFPHSEYFFPKRNGDSQIEGELPLPFLSKQIPNLTKKIFHTRDISSFQQNGGNLPLPPYKNH